MNLLFRVRIWLSDLIYPGDRAIDDYWRDEDGDLPHMSALPNGPVIYIGPDGTEVNTGRSIAEAIDNVSKEHEPRPGHLLHLGADAQIQDMQVVTEEEFKVGRTPNHWLGDAVERFILDDKDS